MLFNYSDKEGSLKIPPYVFWISLFLGLGLSYLSLWVLPPVDGLPAEMPLDGILPPRPPLPLDVGILAFVILTVIFGLFFYVVITLVVWLLHKVTGFPKIERVTAKKLEL